MRAMEEEGVSVHMAKVEKNTRQDRQIRDEQEGSSMDRLKLGYSQSKRKMYQVEGP